MRAPGATCAGIAYWKLPIVTVPPVSGGLDVVTTGLGLCVGLGLALVVVGATVLGGVVVRGAAVVVRAAGVVGGTVVRAAVVGVADVFTGDGTTENVIVGLALVGLGFGPAMVVGASVVG